MKKYDIIREIDLFECEHGLHIPVDLVSSGDQNLDEKNVATVKRKWKLIWPSAVAFLKGMREENGFDSDFPTESLRAKLMLADTDMSQEGVDWEVSFTIATDGYGEWGVALIESKIDPEMSQHYS